MKKIISLVLALSLVFGACLVLASCGGEGSTDNGGATVNTKIGVQAGTTGYYYVKGDADWGFDGIAGFDATAYSNGALAVTDMKNGNIDYVIIDEQPAKSLANSVNGIKVIDIPLTEEEYAFGVDKAQPELLASVNAIIAAMKADGDTKLEVLVNFERTEDSIQ